VGKILPRVRGVLPILSPVAQLGSKATLINISMNVKKRRKEKQGSMIVENNVPHGNNIYLHHIHDQLIYHFESSQQPIRAFVKILKKHYQSMFNFDALRTCYLDKKCVK